MTLATHFEEDGRGEKIVIEVTDTGIGINQSEYVQIFKRFSNVKFKKKINNGGSGIGLTLCKKLSDLLNIQLSVSSKKNVGTTFTMKL